MEKNCKGWKVHSEMNKGVKRKEPAGQGIQNKTKAQIPLQTGPNPFPSPLLLFSPSRDPISRKRKQERRRRTSKATGQTAAIALKIDLT